MSITGAFKLLGATLVILCGFTTTLGYSAVPDYNAFDQRVHPYAAASAVIQKMLEAQSLQPPPERFKGGGLQIETPPSPKAQEIFKAKTIQLSSSMDQSVLEKCAALLKQGIVCMFAGSDKSIIPPPRDSIARQKTSQRSFSPHPRESKGDLADITSLSMIAPAAGIRDLPQQPQRDLIQDKTLDINGAVDADDTVTQAAMRAAVEVVRNRYTDALYQAQLNGGDVNLDTKDAVALTQSALSSAAERAFEAYMRENFGKRDFEGQSYDGLRGYFTTAFKHAATTSIKSIGTRFVQDVTAGGNFKSLTVRSELLKGVDENIAKALIDTGLAAAKNSQYSFLRNLEFSYSIRENSKPEYSLLTLQPLYSSASRKHNVFAQAALTYENSRQSMTGGVGYRYMPPSEDYVIGSNLFLDYQRPYNHLRVSAGLDFQTSLWGASANYYKGLSDWRSSRTGFQEKALDGFDLELAGRMPFLPALEVFGRGYRWQGLEGVGDTDGTEVRVEYSPVPAFTIEALINDEDGRDTEMGMGVRYNYVFGAPPEYLYDWDEQFRQKSASEYIYRKVRRENTIRVQERADPNAVVDNSSNVAITAFSPANAATGVSVGTNVVLTFAQDIQAAAGDIVFTDLTDGSDDFTIPVGDARIGIASNVVTIDLSAQLLDFSSDYDVTYAAGVFEDLSGLEIDALNSGDYSFQTVANPLAGFPAPTLTFAAGSTSASIEPATVLGTWHTTINLGATPDGVIFESGATGQGIAASFGGGNLVFAAGDGAATSTGSDSIFGSVSTASLTNGLHHFVFVANPVGPAEIGVYIDGIRVVNNSIAGAMQSNEWAGTDGSGYGQSSGNIRAGVDTSNLSGATLTTNLSFYSGSAPAGF